MNTHNVTLPEQTLTPETTLTPSPGPDDGLAGLSGSAGCPARSPGHPSWHPPLPGFESCFPKSPLELDNSTKSLTDIIDPIFNSWKAEQASRVGACLNVFPSGEITGGFYRRGPRDTPEKRAKVISQQFSRQARKTIRRAVESGITSFKLFITLTFDPKLSQLNETGQVSQEWAKKECKRFLNTVKKRYDRKAENAGKEHQELNYIWVAEIQEKNTKNIHFHILVDHPFIPVQWLVKIWNQAPNSVNVKKLNNQEHAVHYMLKYMGKGHCPIEGKRYGMTQNLLVAIRPLKLRYEGKDKREAFSKVKRALSQGINDNGGRDMLFGLVIPAPKRARYWRDGSGQVHKTEGISSQVGKRFLRQVKLIMAKVDVERAGLREMENYADDLPFQGGKG